PLALKLTSTITNEPEILAIDEDGLDLLLYKPLFDKYLILFKFIFNKHVQWCINRREELEFEKKYCDLDYNRMEIEGRLIKINACFNNLNGLNSDSGVTPDNIQCVYERVLNTGLIFLNQVEAYKNNGNALDKCLIALDKADEHPENLTFLEPVRYFINLCSGDVKKYIWRTLYDRCAKGVIEDNWSENHYGEFLPELKKIIEEAKN